MQNTFWYGEYTKHNHVSCGDIGAEVEAYGHNPVVKVTFFDNRIGGPDDIAVTRLNLNTREFLDPLPEGFENPEHTKKLVSEIIDWLDYLDDIDGVDGCMFGD